MKTMTRLGMLAAAGATLALSSCSIGGTSPSGFLSNLSQLDGSYGTDNAVSSYVKPGVDFKKYDSVIIDPVTTVIASTPVNPAVIEQLAAYLGSAIYNQMSSGLKVVSAPSATTLRVRTNLTNVLLNQKNVKAVTKVHSSPKANLTGILGTAPIAYFVSNVSFEGEVVDSVSGDRLVALVDHRLGSKREVTENTTWASVRDSINMGIGKLSARFKAVGGR